MMSAPKFNALLICICVLLGAYGLSSRMSYTNITKQEDYLNKLDVAEITGKFAENDCKELRRDLPLCPYILQVEAVSDLLPEYHICKQKVRIKQVYAGDKDISIDDEIYILSRRWAIDVDKTENCIERGFVNVLKKGRDYLVFCTEKVNVKSDVPVYRTYEDSYITPVFCCDSIDNVIAPVSGDSTYVPYESVKNNEFFAADEKADQAWKDLKDHLFKIYDI